MITISPARQTEIPEIKKLLKSTWYDTYGHIFSQEAIEKITNNWHSEENLQNQTIDNETYFAVAKEGETIVGISTSRKLDDKTVHIGRLYIDPNHQRKGIGTLLLKDIVAHFPEIIKLTLEVETENPKGCAFYLKNGFTKMREQEDVVEGTTLHSVVMEKEIKKGP